MKIGYMRVSTDDQDLSLQKAALERAGCEKIFSDKASGKTTSRTGLDQALSLLKPGDVFTVWKIDRLGRRSAHVITLVEELTEKGIGFVSLTEGFDTTTPMGEAMVGILAVFAQLERRVISQRTKAGMAAAKANGKHLGRHAEADPRMILVEKRLREGLSIRETAEETGVNRGKVQRLSKKLAHELRPGSDLI